MGMSAGGSSGGPKSEMNVAPLVDVLLVLLVIFMVTMPVMMRSITIEIPRELEDTEISEVKANIVVKGLLDGMLEVSDGLSDPDTISRTALATVLASRLKGNTGKNTVFVDFDNGVPWEDVIGIMDTIKGVGQAGEGEAKSDNVTVALKKRSLGDDGAEGTSTGRDTGEEGFGD